jgi:hypothetical protein
VIYIFVNGFTIVQSDNKYGFINEFGEEICEIKYDYASEFKNDFAFVKLNGKYGAINRLVDEIIEPIYNVDELYNTLEQYIKNQERNLKLNQLI